MMTNSKLYAGAGHLRGIGKPVSEAGARCADLLGWVFRGLYHLEEAADADWSGPMVEIDLRGSMATYDHSVLTRLVIAAHDMAIRVEISAEEAPFVDPDGRRFRAPALRLRLSPRGRDGGFWERHPPIEEAINGARGE